MEKFRLEWALQESRKAQGFLRSGEEELLYKFSFDKPKGTHTYEIGSRRGRSTILLAAACKLSNNGIVFAIDPHMKPAGQDIKPQYDLWKEQGVFDTYEDFCNNIKMADVDDYVQGVRSTSELVGRAMAKNPYLEVNKIGFLFIDGCHQRSFVEMDFDLFSPFVVPGGCIAFHDSNPGNADYEEGPAIVAQTRLIDSGNFERCDRFKSLTYGYKK